MIKVEIVVQAIVITKVIPMEKQKYGPVGYW